jgi:CRP-like cAMP-binding protein
VPGDCLISIPNSLHAATRWPTLLAAVQQRLADQQARLATQGLVLQLPRAEHRILVTLWLLAERCGRVTPDGLPLPLTFTHEALSRMTGARRPTVSLALAHLQTTGCVRVRGEQLVLTAAAQKEVLAVTAHQDDLAIGATVRTNGLPTLL